jgi:hypothetical protein
MKVVSIITLSLTAVALKFATSLDVDRIKTELKDVDDTDNKRNPKDKFTRCIDSGLCTNCQPSEMVRFTRLR